MTTTRIPEVPSGGVCVFCEDKDVCVMWASPVSSRVIVTTQIEWTGRSFIKGVYLISSFLCHFQLFD